MAHIARTTSIALLAAVTTASAVGAGLAARGADQPVGDRIDLEVASAVPIAPAQPTEQPVRPAPASTPLTEHEQGLVDWAEQRFADAGLSLPEMTVRFDPTRELCGYADGRYQQDAEGDRVVTICSRPGDSFAADLHRRRTLLHEFGHAWDYANLTDDDRAELAVVLGTAGWDDREAAWEDRGVERFAEAFVYALLDQRLRQVKVDLGCEALVGAFELATGAEPLGPHAPECAS